MQYDDEVVLCEVGAEGMVTRLYYVRWARTMWWNVSKFQRSSGEEVGSWGEVWSSVCGVSAGPMLSMP